MNTSKCIGYIRVSTEEQQKSGLSLAFQRERIESYAKFNQIPKIDIIEEQGSGKSMDKRPLFVNIFNAIQKKEISQLIVYKLDRLSRSIKDVATLLESFDKNGIKFVSIAENLDTTTATGKFTINILGSIAQWERETISERTKNALSIKKDRNELISGIIPYGYKTVKTKMLTKKGLPLKKLVAIPEEQEIITTMKDMKAKGRSYVYIADYLNDHFFNKTRKGGMWYPATVRHILKRLEDNK